MKNNFLLSLLIGLLFISINDSMSQVYRPIYVAKDVAQKIAFESPREVETQGKIYIKDQWIFIGDVNKGIHIIDNTNPENPQKIGFLRIYGNHDISIKGNTLYADNFSDLIAIDISNMQEPTITKRISGVYTLQASNYPPNVPYGTYFECIDSEKGYVIGWEEADVVDPKCYTTY